MATGVDNRTGRLITGWAYTVQCLNEVANRMIGESVMREYVGSLNPGLLVKQNLLEGPLDRFTYGLILQWELWVPMFGVTQWEYKGIDQESSGGLAIHFQGRHLPNAHKGDYSLESNRIIRAAIAANAAQILVT